MRLDKNLTQSSQRYTVVTPVKLSIALASLFLLFLIVIGVQQNTRTVVDAIAVTKYTVQYAPATKSFFVKGMVVNNTNTEIDTRIELVSDSQYVSNSPAWIDVKLKKNQDHEFTLRLSVTNQWLAQCQNVDYENINAELKYSSSGFSKVQKILFDCKSVLALTSISSLSLNASDQLQEDKTAGCLYACVEDESSCCGGEVFWESCQGKQKCCMSRCPESNDKRKPIPTSTSFPKNRRSPNSEPIATIIPNIASSKSCSTVCAEAENISISPNSKMSCQSAGLDKNAVDSRYWTVLTKDKCEAIYFPEGLCYVKMKSVGVDCDGKLSSWTNCKCQSSTEPLMQ